MNPYIGHSSQISGVEELRLVGGKGDGMRLLQVRNGLGLEFTVSCNRCADLSRLSFKSGNYGFFSACGYVAPAYYDSKDFGFMKSFTAGFLTTAGLNNVGDPCTDAGEQLPLHGTIGNTPAEHVCWTQDDGAITITAEIPDRQIFAHKLRLLRTYVCSTRENTLTIRDKIINDGIAEYPVQLLYHMNMGYPLLSEHSELYIPSKKVVPKDPNAGANLDKWDKISPPAPHFEFECFDHIFEGEALAAIYSPILGTGLAIRYDSGRLEYFNEWKMLQARDYVLGLEPGNCHTGGRDRMRAEGMLTVLQPDESIEYEIRLEMLGDKEAFDALKK